MEDIITKGMKTVTDRLEESENVCQVGRKTYEFEEQMKQRDQPDGRCWSSIQCSNHNQLQGI